MCACTCLRESERETREGGLHCVGGWGGAGRGGGGRRRRASVRACARACVAWERGVGACASERASVRACVRVHACTHECGRPVFVCGGIQFNHHTFIGRQSSEIAEGLTKPHTWGNEMLEMAFTDGRHCHEQKPCQNIVGHLAAVLCTLGNGHQREDHDYTSQPEP